MANRSTARGATAFPGPGPRKERTTEIARLKRELARVTEERDILKKAARYFAREFRDLPFMQAHHREFRLTRMCGVLQVSRSGFYAWQHRGMSARTRANLTLIERMRILHQQTREAYGARKMWQLLNREGLVCGRHRVARLRRLAGIVALRRRRYVRTVQVRQYETPAVPNRLNQQFAVSAKNRVWAGDLTFVPTRTGWLTVAVLLDLNHGGSSGGP